MARADLQQLFQEELTAGSIVDAGRLPSFRVLANRYGCSTATVKRLVDQFELKGWLRTIRGAGTFVANGDTPVRPARRRQVGIIVLNDQSQRDLEILKEEYLALGWVFSIYNASVDVQSPEREKNFLKLAMEQDFEAVILEATPIEPVNTELFRQLRHEGIKVVHLSPYRDDMGTESAFMPDFYAAGQVAAARLALAGYRRILFYSGEITAPFLGLGHAGLRMMAEQLGLELLPEVAGDTPETVLQRLRQSDVKSAVFCADTELSKRLEAILPKASSTVRPGILALSAYCGAEIHHSHFDFPYLQLMRNALAFATDRNRDPFEPIQQRFAPQFVNHNSF